MEAAEAEEFWGHLAVNGLVSASTENQAKGKAYNIITPHPLYDALGKDAQARHESSKTVPPSAYSDKNSNGWHMR